MAIVQQDPRLKKDDQNQMGGDTISGTSGAPTQASPDLNQQSPAGGPGPDQPAQPAQQAPQQPQQSQQRPTNAPRSGMATNVQQYVQKNQPAAQNIAGAVTKNVTSQTGSIAQQADQKRKALEQQVNVNQQKVASSKDFAQQQIQNILNPQEQAQPQTETNDAIGAQAQPVENQLTPDAEAKNRFQRLLQGDVGVNKTGNINLASEKARLNQIQNLAGGMNTEQGRLAAMGQTFGKNREYKRGQSALDQLILGGTEGAQEKLIQDTQQAFEGTKNQLGNITQKTQEQLKQEEAMLASLPQEVQQMFTGANEGVLSAVDEQLATRQAERQALTGEIDPQVQAYQEMVSGLSGLSDRDLVDKIMSSGNRQISDADKFLALQNTLPPELQNQFKVETIKNKYGPSTQRLVSTSNNPEALQQLNEMYLDKLASGDITTNEAVFGAKGKYMGGFTQGLFNQLGIDQNRLKALGYDENYGSQLGTQIMGGRSGRTRSLGFNDLLSTVKGIRDKSAGFGREQALAQAFEGTDLAPDQLQSYLKGEDLSRGSILSQDQMRRQQLEALSSLGGKTLDPSLLQGNLLTESAETDQQMRQRVLDNLRKRGLS